MLRKSLKSQHDFEIHIFLKKCKFKAKKSYGWRLASCNFYLFITILLPFFSTATDTLPGLTFKYYTTFKNKIAFHCGYLWKKNANGFLFLKAYSFFFVFQQGAKCICPFFLLIHLGLCLTVKDKDGQVNRKITTVRWTNKKISD